MTTVGGEFVTETLDYDGGRQVAAYIPATAAVAVVYAGDGGWHTMALAEASRPPTHHRR